MEYLNLTDDEIYDAIKIAREMTSKMEVPFLIAIQKSLDLKMEEREEHEKRILTENPLYVQDNQYIKK